MARGSIFKEQMSSPNLTEASPMLRKLLVVVVLLALPVLLAAQAKIPTVAATPAAPHGIATQVQGEVASPVEEVDGQNNQQGADEANGQNHDGQEGDQVEHEGVDEPGGLNNEVDEPGEHASQSGHEDDQGTPPPPPATGQSNQVGRHKP